jgi:hypothetical protein
MASLLDLVSFRRWRTRLRTFAQRVEQLERRLRETEAIVDVLLADSVFRPDPATGMNGQQKRKQIVELICADFRPQLAVETGTFFGSTTGYLATTLRVPIISCDLRERYHHVARRLLRELPHVELRLQDSRSFLRALASDSETTRLRTFFYLDAHWYDDLPLRDELDIIARHWHDFVAVIDDFLVPDAPDYGYDDYGTGRRIDLSFVEACLAQHGLRAFFPRVPACEETGQRRGYCIIIPERSTNALARARHLLCEARPSTGSFHRDQREIAQST